MIDIALKLLTFGVGKYIQAVYRNNTTGDNTTQDNTTEFIELVTEVVGEKVEAEKVKELRNKFKELYDEHMPSEGEDLTAEQAAEDFIKALPSELVKEQIDEYHTGKNSDQQAKRFARYIWNYQKEWRRNQYLPERLEGQVEKLCLTALEKSFLAVVSSKRYISDGMRRIEKAMTNSVLTLKTELPHEMTRDGVPSVNCWHREKELATLQKMLKSTRKLVLVSGFGGIGKTTLARELYHKINRNYVFSGWVTYSGGLKQSLAVAFRDEVVFRNKNKEGYNIDDNIEQRAESILNFLKDNQQSKLLMIDNVEQNEAYEPLLDDLTGYENLTVILTSRLEGIGCYEPFLVDFLSEDACIDLFIRYFKNFKSKREPNRDTVRNLVRLVRCHTLSVELLAKSAKREPNLEHYYEKMKEIGLQYPKLPVIAGAKKARRTMAEHLKKLFDWTNQDDEKVRILRNFALFPSVTIPVEVTDWISCSLDELEQLIESGWLAYHEEDDNHSAGYYMHPLVKDVLLLDREQFPDSIGEEFCKCLWKEEYIQRGIETYVTALPKLEIATGFMDSIVIRNDITYASACNALGTLLREFGIYRVSQTHFERARDIGENVLDKEDGFLGAIYNNLALLYDLRGMYKDAKVYYAKALEICEKVLGAEHSSTATMHNNIAGLHQLQGRYQEAEEYYVKALEISEKVLGAEHPDTATTYNNLAALYKSQGRYKESEEYCLKALAISEKTLGTEHPDTATTYHNLGCLYHSKGDYNTALAWMLKALKIILVKLGAKHPDVKTVFEWLDDTYSHSSHAQQQDFIDWLMSQLSPEEQAIMSEFLSQHPKP